MFDTLSQTLVKLANPEGIQKYKTTKVNVYKNWREKRENVEGVIRQLN